mmetsp:Transcript_3349/g.11956  ORF Transcript_3349/g.11956 Transcript_3349/m.11956 type:complete len:333 (+) Transcript_3349:372-1370(+)
MWHLGRAAHHGIPARWHVHHACLCYDGCLGLTRFIFDSLGRETSVEIGHCVGAVATTPRSLRLLSRERSNPTCLRYSCVVPAGAPLLHQDHRDLAKGALIPIQDVLVSSSEHVSFRRLFVHRGKAWLSCLLAWFHLDRYWFGCAELARGLFHHVFGLFAFQRHQELLGSPQFSKFQVGGRVRVGKQHISGFLQDGQLLLAIFSSCAFPIAFQGPDDVVQLPNLPIGPSGDSIVPTPCLEHGDAEPELLGDFVDGEMEVGGQFVGGEFFVGRIRLPTLGHVGVRVHRFASCSLVQLQRIPFQLFLPYDCTVVHVLCSTAQTTCFAMTLAAVQS